jgi:hypothetical protein
MKQFFYSPDFEAECRICGFSPCVVVFRHPSPDTDLCGPHFFNDQEMIDWNLWNDPKETEDEVPRID